MPGPFDKMRPTPSQASSFLVMSLRRRCLGWIVIARVGFCFYRRYWTESDAPSRAKLRADFAARPEAWTDVD